MAKIRIPLLSLGATKTIGKALTFVRRRGQNIAEVKPEIPDAKTLVQLSWRHMFQKAIALWHALSAAEKQEWESLARPKHMTGYAWFISQALKPNPGLYLPLQGGTMQGTIEMDDNHIHGLPLPIHAQDPLRVFEYNSAIAPFLYHEGARVYHDAHQVIPDATGTVLAFNSEKYDTNSFHSNTVNNSRLTCKIAGRYHITCHISWGIALGGYCLLMLRFNGTAIIAYLQDPSSGTGKCAQVVTTIFPFAVNDYVEARVYHTSGAVATIFAEAEYSPIFMMERIGI